MSGLLVPPKDVDALGEAIGLRLSDAERRAGMATAGAESARRFDLKSILDLWEELLTP